MATSGQILSRNGQTRLQPFEQAPRPMVGYANDYLSGHETGLHRHPRAQLLFAIAGVMRIVHQGGLVHRAARDRAVGASRYASQRAYGRRGVHARAVSSGGRRGLGTVGHHCDRSLAAVAGIDSDSL